MVSLSTNDAVDDTEGDAEDDVNGDDVAFAVTFVANNDVALAGALAMERLMAWLRSVKSLLIRPSTFALWGGPGDRPGAGSPEICP